MPELPEVETTRRGLAPQVIGKRIARVIIRDRRLRWPVPRGIEKRLSGCLVQAIVRRGKYLLFDCGKGWLLLHLGMSGSLCLVPKNTPPGKHDHVDIVLADGTTVRLTDPRRFGAMLWAGTDPEKHPLLATLGPEPLTEDFSGEWLYAATRRGRIAIKLWLMDSKRLVGVGNIYANEALFRACIRPTRAAGRVAKVPCERLAVGIRETLLQAIEAGGSTLRDFVGAEGQPGYFQQQYLVYGREGLPCITCGTAIRAIRQSGRASYYCPACQR
jgi:formamidopyrimidine-DNA glycosylase